MGSLLLPIYALGHSSNARALRDEIIEDRLEGWLAYMHVSVSVHVLKHKNINRHYNINDLTLKMRRKDNHHHNQTPKRILPPNSNIHNHSPRYPNNTTNSTHLNHTKRRHNRGTRNNNQPPIIHSHHNARADSLRHTVRENRKMTIMCARKKL